MCVYTHTHTQMVYYSAIVKKKKWNKYIQIDRYPYTTLFHLILVALKDKQNQC